MTAVASFIKTTPIKVKQGASLCLAVVRNMGPWLRTGCVLGYYETAYWAGLFLYSSRKFLRVESYLSLLGAIAFFGAVLLQDMATNQRALLEYCNIYFTIIMVLLAMNLLPREREEDTLEILWSQPMRRGKLIVLQLITLTTWILLLCLFVVFFFSRFSAYPGFNLILLLFVVTNSFAVGAITAVVSTFCRHAIATGLVALLIMGIHLFWLRELGPIQIFYNPLPDPSAKEQQIMWFNIIFNRIVTLALIGFALDYLFRRLRRTAEWFT